MDQISVLKFSVQALNDLKLFLWLLLLLAPLSLQAHAPKIPGDYLTAKPKHTLHHEVAKAEMDKTMEEETRNTSGGRPSLPARMVPNLQDEKILGLKILAVRDSSVFGIVGMQKGDIWLSINGTPVDIKNPFPIEQWRKNPLTYRVFRNGELVEIQIAYK